LPANAAELVLRLAASQDKKVRWRAVQGLSVGRETAKHLTAAQVVPALLQGLSDCYNRIRDAAAYALSQRADALHELDPGLLDTVIKGLEPRESSDWGDGYRGLDVGAGACGHTARLLATLSHQLNRAQRKQAVAGVESAIRRFAHTDATVMFDSMGLSAHQFLQEQLAVLQKPLKWDVPNLLGSLAYPSKQDRRLSCEECDRRLGDHYSQA